MNDTAIERIKSQILERVNQETSQPVCSESEANQLIASIRSTLYWCLVRMTKSGFFTAEECSEVSRYYSELLNEKLEDLRRRERESFQFFE